MTALGPFLAFRTCNKPDASTDSESLLSGETEQRGRGSLARICDRPYPLNYRRKGSELSASTQDYLCDNHFQGSGKDCSLAIFPYLERR